MAIVPSDCLTGCLGVDTVTGLPGNIIDPNGGLECGPNGERLKCPPRDLGLVASGGNVAAALGQAIPANTDVIITDGVNPWIAQASYTNNTSCTVRLHLRVGAGVQGVGMAAYSQSTPARFEIQQSVNGGPFAAVGLGPWLQTNTAPLGWSSGILDIYVPPVTVAPSATYTYAIRCLVRSSTAVTLDARAGSVAFEAWTPA